MKHASIQAPRHLRLPPFTDRLPAPVFFRTEHMPSNSTYPALSHAWGEFVYSFSGITEVKAAGQHCLAPPNLGVWIPKGVEHTGFNHQEAVHCSVYISSRLCTRMPAQLCAVIVSPLVRAMLEHLRSDETDTGSAPARSRMLRVLVDELASCTTTGSYVPSSDDTELDAVLTDLRKDPADDRSLGELARAFHLSERTLIRRCQRDLGMSLTEWRQRLRLISALPLLHMGHSVESVALDMGYATSSAFIAMFRRLMGMSPRRFVNQANE
jgi:AraC-like DNA-binding protein